MRYQQDYGSREVRSRELPDLLTVEDLEGILRMDAKTIYNYVQGGLIPYVRIESNVRFLKRQIVAWIENQILDRHPLPPVPDPITGLVPLLTIKQVANYLNQSTRSVHRLVKTRKLNVIKLDGELRFRVADVERFLEKRLLRTA